ncbi:tripartite tricarboxylate transporter substrate binding protein [Noviherbaspirillum malthae]|uniref:tripartite tricarboxylate transporter substrate binding protein n=1 Tax=Noviherbaspirillum malthae TaxID=1260987 RepID=UPI00188E5DDF|nr:tripartite tricarboxylate transporter substrate binding protein [Noviherbaspirillum malthae]
MHQFIGKTLASVLVLIAGVLVTTQGLAQEYPNKSVKIIVPFGAGGGTDTMARVIADGLNKALNQPFVVDNKPGAGGNVGMASVAKSAKDGYTLLMVTNNIAINPSLYKKVDFHPTKDFDPVAMVGSSPVAISVHSSLNINNLAQMVKYAKANPGKLSYASCGSGTPQHLAAELLSQMTKIEMVHVPYKGCASSVPDHLTGLVPVSFSTVAIMAPHVKSGKIKGIAVTGSERSTYAPNMPTVSEAINLPGYAIDVWFGLFAPAGTPKAIIAKLNSVINKQLATAEVKAKMTEQNYDVLGGRPEVLAEKVSQDIPRYESVIRIADIKPD